MRRLLLLRHARSDRAESTALDRERPLSEEGRADPSKIGVYMVHHALVPDLVLVSPSTRTRETWALIAPAFERAPPVKSDERIYEATPETILDVIKETESGIGTLLVVGHNPGLQELALILIASGDVDMRRRLKEDFPTSALAVIDFALDEWSRLHPHSGRLVHFVTPQQLVPETD